MSVIFYVALGCGKKSTCPIRTSSPKPQNCGFLTPDWWILVLTHTVHSTAKMVKLKLKIIRRNIKPFDANISANIACYDKGNTRFGVDYQHEMPSIECIKLVIYDKECHYLMYPIRQLQSPLAMNKISN